MMVKKNTLAIQVKFIAYFLAIFLIANSAFAQVGNWKLDNNVNDATTNSIHGTVVNAPTFSTSSKEGSHALVLNGTNQYVDLGNPASFPSGTQARTISAWAKPSTITGLHKIFAYGTALTGKAMYIGQSATSLVAAGYGNEIVIPNFWAADVWRHICLTYDGTTARVYADGIEIASSVQSWNLALSRAYIGRHVNDIHYWGGSIDDVRIYNSALTAEQVQQLAVYSPGVPSDPTGLTASQAGTTQIQLNWTDNSNNETGFQIERSTNSSTGFVLVGTTLSGATSYVDKNLSPTTTYYYRIRARNGSDYSSYTTVVNATTKTPAGLVGHWQLNNNGNDASANGLNGTPRNSVGFSTDAKEGTHSLSTNGTNHYVDLNNPSALPWGSDPRSISVWAKTTTTSGTHTVVGYGHNISFKAMFIAQDGTSLVAGSKSSFFTIPNFWTANTWRHICLTYDGTSAKVYGDGVELASGVMPWSGLELLRAFIGRDVSTSDYWTGLIDDARIYDKALSLSEVQVLANLAPAAPTAFVATPVTSTTVNLSWTDNSSNETGFEIERSLTAGTGFTTIATVGPNITSYSDQTLTKGPTYFYRIRAVLNAVGSSYTSEVSTNTIPPVGQGQVWDAEELAALQDIYNNLGGANWNKAVYWPTSTPWPTPNTAWGVTISGNDVTRIDLHDSNLIGELPQSIGTLTQLEYLFLYSNQISGSIPLSFGNLKKLQFLYLEYNQLTGSIPSIIGEMSELRLIHLNFNTLSGTIPGELNNLTKLTDLSLGANQLTGEIIPLTGLVNLDRLHLNDNNFTPGPVPIWITTLPKLKNLFLSNTNRTSIPDEIGNIATLQRLEMTRNPTLTGPIPSTIGQLSELLYLWLDHNQLSGSIPSSIGSLSNLAALTLGNNQLSGSIPAEITNATKLNSLSLSWNQLSGPIPTNLGNLNRLAILQLENNQLSGPIPISIGNCVLMTHLNLSSNTLSGTIPSTIGNLVELNYLHLASNSFTGIIPNEIGNLTKVAFLSLANNQLSGAIPATMGNMTALTRLFLFQNSLTGAVPSSFANLINLTDFYVSNNLLTGTIPATWSAWTKLNYFAINGNRFTGQFPDILTSWPMLHTFIIGSPAGNEFVGPFPDVTGVNELRTINTSYNKFTTMPESILTLPALTTLSLYSNELVSIPNLASQANKANLAVDIRLNRLDFTHLEPLIGGGIKSLTYNAQREINDITSLGFVTGQTLLIPARPKGVNSTLTWQKLVNGTWVNINGSNGDPTGLTFTKVNASAADVGTYRWVMTNSVVAGTISSVSINVFNDLGTVPDAVELAALKALYQSTNGANWTNKTNWPQLANWPSSATSADFATWYGVTVTNGDVTAVALVQNNLNGPIPTEIGNLQQLKSLDLRINPITGTIPLSLTTVTSLTHLRLYANQLTGPIPPEIGNLTNLQHLVLSSNGFTGQIPASIGNLTQLSWLSLYGLPGINGSLPNTFFNLVNLTDLHIFDTNIGGVLSENIGNFTKLKTFYGYRNKWSGPLPAALGNVTTIENLYLYSNDFSGAMPDWSGLVNLKNLWIHDNELTGELPAWMGGFSQIQILSVGQNHFTGTIPETYGNLTELTALYLYNLPLSGPIPQSFQSLNKLTVLDIKNCGLEGGFLASLMLKPTLKTFYLHGNKFTELPDFTSRVDKASLTVTVQGNQVPVEQLERYFTASNVQPLLSFSYGPQVDPNQKSALGIPLHSTFRIDAPSGGAHGVYAWERMVNGTWTSINSQNVSTSPNAFVLPTATGDMAGQYRYIVTNSWMPQILFESGPIDVTITDAANATVTPLYNGLITSVRWRTDKAYGTDGEDLKGMYLYEYDEKYQIKDGTWADYTNTSFTTAGNKYRLTNMSYDPNGNIQTLRRYNEQGLIQHDFNYHYKYEDQSPTYNNQLQSVSGYTNAYSYNALGQMIGEDKVEEGKDQYVEYDVSGKVVKVFSDPAKTQASLKIENLYDDRGFRLAKINYATSRTTWYIRDASGNVISIYEQDGIASEATAATSEITLTEVPVYGAGKLGTTYPQEDGSTNYEITDHLGNVRALVRDNINVYVATMEDNGVEDEEDPFANPRIEEMQYFENLFETEVDDVHMNVTPPSAKVTNPDKASYLFWNDTPGTTKEEKAIGPSIALKVNKGDKIDVSVWARYEEKLNYARDFNLTALSGLLGSTFVSQTGFEGYSTTQTSSTLLGALTAAAFGTDTDNTRPYAYLNYVILDNALGYRNGDAARVPETAGSEPAELYLPANKPVKFGFGEEIVVEEDGYIYIWVSNESHSTRVWFDDLTVTHEQNLVVQASDYGVWGDLLREQRTDDKKYRFGYQGQYAEKDEETGWNHFELREYDPVTGRWTIGDPYRQFFSAYLALGNNPVNLRDRDGGKGEIIPGADGKPISAEVQDGKIVITENGTEQLQHLVNLINASGSTNAVEDFMNAVQSPGIVNVVLDLVNTPPLYGYHQPHDANGRALVWDATKQKFDGIPAVIKAPDGSLRYKEATVTLYLLNMWSARDRLPGIVKHQLGITDMKVTVKEFIVDVFSHEMYHNLDQGSIYKTSTQDNSYDFEGPAYQREWETHLQIMNNRP